MFIAGAVRHSRLEYKAPTDDRYKENFEFEIDVKTLASDGIIFYSAEPNKQDLISIYLKNGKVMSNHFIKVSIILNLFLINFCLKRSITNSTVEVDQHC